MVPPALPVLKYFQKALPPCLLGVPGVWKLKMLRNGYNLPMTICIPLK
jgi:hypothetical protein